MPRIYKPATVSPSANKAKVPAIETKSAKGSVITEKSEKKESDAVH